MKPRPANLSELSQRRASLNVKKEAGEAALKLLARKGLLDLRLKLRQRGENLALPLTRQPSSQELMHLEEHLGSLALGEEEFEVKTPNVLSLEDLLADKLPPNLLGALPASYDIIGDLAVVDFAPELSAHEKLVAEAILKIHKNLRGVFAKAGAVSGTNRIRALRHVAGEARTVTVHKEFGCRFKLDIAKAYFSPRLSREHHLVAEMVLPGENVVDMFAGVGPFSIMIAKRLENVEVDAIDSNPEAVRLIEENVRLNKPKGKVRAWAGDAREVVEGNLAGKASRVIMNHPSAAREYVDAGLKALRREGGTLHYYTFSEGLDYEAKAMTELGKALTACGWAMKEKAGARTVRGVAPMQWQVAIDATVVPARR